MDAHRSGSTHEVTIPRSYSFAICSLRRDNLGVRNQVIGT
jgi:hypothetical protein